MSEDDCVASPCVGVCRMDMERGWCRGCFRTLEEIARWAAADDTERLRILDRVVGRRQEES